MLMKNALWLPAGLSQTSHVRGQNSTRTGKMHAHPPTTGLARLQPEKHHPLLCQLLRLQACTLSTALSLT